MLRLYSTTIFDKAVVLRGSTPQELPVPSPAPGEDIFIFNAMTALHITRVVGSSRTAVALRILRASDRSRIGFTHLYVTPGGQFFGIDDIERNWEPSAYLVAAGDSLVIEVVAEGGDQTDGETNVTALATIAYSKRSESPFERVLSSAGNILIGLKADGTFWKASAADTPLVWTAV